MPVAFRIVKARHRRTAFDGEGARVAGGRWNHPGDAVVYASGSLALAAIETFVHLGEDGLHIGFVYFRVEIPDDLAIERLRKLPAQWRDEPGRRHEHATRLELDPQRPDCDPRSAVGYPSVRDELSAEPEPSRVRPHPDRPAAAVRLRSPDVEMTRGFRVAN